MTFEQLSMSEVTSTYNLFRFLERLRVIGHISAHTVGFIPNVDEFGSYAVHEITNNEYAIIKDGFSNDKTYIQQIELLEKVFGRQSFTVA